MSNKTTTHSKPANHISLIGYFKGFPAIFSFILFFANVYWHSQFLLVVSVIGFILYFLLLLSDLLIQRKPVTKIYIFGLGLIVGTALSFGIFAPNRDYVFITFVATPTPTPSATLRPTNTPDTSLCSSQTETQFSTPTLLATKTVIPSPTSTVTASQTTTAAPTPPRIIFNDSFLDNGFGWSVPFVRTDLKTDIGQIIAGAYTLDLQCSADSGDACISWLKIPNVVERDFDLHFDTNIIKISPHDSRVVLIIRFRNLKDRFYSIYISNANTISMDMKMNKYVSTLLKETHNPDLTFISGKDTTFRMMVKDSKFILFEDGSEIFHMEDGNISSEGEIDLGFYLPTLGSYASIRLDNVRVEETP